MSNLIPNLKKLQDHFSSAVTSMGESLAEPRRRLFVTAFAAAGTIGGASLSYGLGELGQEMQMEIQGITAAEYDSRQPKEAAISALFYGAVGTGYGFMFAPLVAARRREEAVNPVVSTRLRIPRDVELDIALASVQRPVPGPFFVHG